MEEVTKSKSEGRVAAGNRLVEWNRKNKADLLKNKTQVGSSDAPSVQVSARSPESSRATFYGGGAVAILIGVGFALYLYHGKIASRLSVSTSDSIPSKASPAPSEPDIFRMN